MNIVITIDKGVPFSDTRQPSAMHTLYKDKLLSMQIGDSFFVAGKTHNDLAALVRYATTIGVGLIVLDVEQDEIYMERGVRLWRSEPATNGTRLRAPTEAQPEASAAATRYWYHAEGDHLFTTDTDTAASEAKADGMTTELTKERYEAKLADRKAKSGGKDPNAGIFVGAGGVVFFRDTTCGECFEVKDWSRRSELEKDPDYERIDYATLLAYRADQDKFVPGWWQHDGTGQVLWFDDESELVTACKSEILDRIGQVEDLIEKLRVDPTSEVSEDSKQEFVQQMVSAELDTYWRRPSGVCVAMPPGSFYTIRATKGIVQIDKAEYDKWLAEQDEEL